MELSVGQGLILYTLIVIAFTVGVVESVRTVRKTRRIMKECLHEVDE